MDLPLENGDDAGGVVGLTREGMIPPVTVPVFPGEQPAIAAASAATPRARTRRSIELTLAQVRDHPDG